MATVSASPASMHNPVMGALGIQRSDSPRGAPPIYDVPYGSVQLAGPSASGIAGFDLGAGFGATEYEGIEDDEDDENEGEAAEDDDDSSEEGSSKAKGGKGKADAKGSKSKKPKTEAKGEKDAKTGRRKIKIEFIEDDARRHITFSKRKAGIMKKAYELATLTGTQVLLLVVSQTGLVYTFTTPKLQALVTQAEGRNLIQACLNAPDPVAGSGDGSEGGTPGDEDGSNDDGSRPGSSGGASTKGKRPAKAGEIMTGPNTDFKKRSRNNSTSKASSASQAGDGDDTNGNNKRGRGRPRKDTNNSAAGGAGGAYDGDTAQKRRRTGSKSTGSSAMESNTSTSMSSSSGGGGGNAGHIGGGHLAGVLEHSQSVSIISPTMRGDQLQMMQSAYGGQQNPGYAYNPMAYFGAGAGDPNAFGMVAAVTQGHQHGGATHHHIGGLGGGADGSMGWGTAGAMSPHSQAQHLFGMDPAPSSSAAGQTAATTATDRSGGVAFNYGLTAQSSPYTAYPHLLPAQEVPEHEQRW